ncbi:MAG: hypothetical protein ABIP75_00965 [Pyrinomonadaceae bacterium]
MSEKEQTSSNSSFGWGAVGALIGIIIKVIVVFALIDNSINDWSNLLFGLAVIFGAIPTLLATMTGVGLVLIVIERINEHRMQPLNAVARGVVGATTFALIGLTLMVVLKLVFRKAGFWSNAPWILTGLIYPDLSSVAGAMAGVLSTITWKRRERYNSPVTVLNLE